MIHRQAMRCVIRKKVMANHISRSIPMLTFPTLFMLRRRFFMCLTSLSIRASLVILINLYNLGKRATLAKDE